MGGFLDLSGTQITNKRHYKKLKNGDFVENKYLYADEILTHIKRVKKIGYYTYFAGKIKGRNVIFDGREYAHCKNFREGVRDIEFKKAKDRGAEQYKKYNLDSVVTKDEAITMYRIITGACQAGTNQFLSNIQEIKEKYTISEIISITKGQYGAYTFESFFKEAKQ